MLLGCAGFRVETACDGREGVAKGIALQPRAAVVDIGLPMLDGFGVARELRGALGSGVLLIANTAWSGPEFRERAKAAGFDHFLGKPCDPEELIDLLR
jgi:DNA-binding response OmpR family regulator